MGPEFSKLLQHGIGVHHAGVLPSYRRLVEELTADRLLKFVVTTETIAAGINLPAKRCVFPSLKKVIKKDARLLVPAEYHQMAGRAGRPQFDTEGIAITLAPEEVVQEFRRELRETQKRSSGAIGEEKIKKKHYARAKAEAKSKNDVSWDREDHLRLVDGQPAALKSQSKVTAEQILAIGLPDLSATALLGEGIASTGPSMPTEDAASGAAQDPMDERAPGLERLDITKVISHLLLPDAERWEAHKRLAQITRNLQALGVLDEAGRPLKGEMIGKIRGIDGTFVHFVFENEQLDPPLAREMLEYLIEHDAIQRKLEQVERALRKAWVLERLRELRRESPQITFEDVEAMYEEEHPYVPTRIEVVHQTFLSKLPHPELHGGKRPKQIWAEIETRS
ncbi:MAG: hypothetical protein HC923_01910 [Myxococcales bacterium]|nr:hypothetical protein [Myxococcales bacterium]